MIYVTGDCHADWTRFSMGSFPEQKEMTRDDFVIVCGDFGLWHDTPTEKWWFKWFAQKNFTVLFVDGNHENFDRLYGNEFKIVDFHGGKAHKISENIYHLMRGYVFELDGKKIFTFGGAKATISMTEFSIATILQAMQNFKMPSIDGVSKINGFELIMFLGGNRKCPAQKK